MAVPRAQMGGMYGSGLAQQANPQIDIASIINAGAAGASSLLQGAYLRKVALANQQAAIAQRTFENKRQSDADARAASEFEWKRGEADRNYALKKLELGIQPATTIPPGIVSPLPTKIPERVDVRNTPATQRALLLKQTPSAKSKEETPGTPEYLKTQADLADVRAKAAARYRLPATEGEVQSQRVAIRTALGSSTEKYQVQRYDARKHPLPVMSPLQAQQQAMADQIAIFGEAAVRDAVGGIAPLKTPGPGLSDRARAIRTPTFGAKPTVPGQAPAAAVAAPTRPPVAPTSAPATPRVPVPLRAGVGDAEKSKWVQANPPKPGETQEAYRARFASHR